MKKKVIATKGKKARLLETAEIKPLNEPAKVDATNKEKALKNTAKNIDYSRYNTPHQLSEDDEKELQEEVKKARLEFKIGARVRFKPYLREDMLNGVVTGISFIRSSKSVTIRIKTNDGKRYKKMYGSQDLRLAQCEK